MKKYEEDLSAIKNAIDRAKNIKYKAEARLEELENQEKRLLMELEELGVKPDELDDTIYRMEKEIAEGIEKAKQNIPKELMRHD
ncbi:hypothetical protein [Alteribacter populi]|uniref:hypothetical protein n=1 Tax=Alteribacter populi TaxID=2011011 RepID=UPI000BBAAAB9|nr:hypothetical protein [Alteribacter populi]